MPPSESARPVRPNFIRQFVFHQIFNASHKVRDFITRVWIFASTLSQNAPNSDVYPGYRDNGRGVQVQLPRPRI